MNVGECFANLYHPADNLLFREGSFRVFKYLFQRAPRDEFHGEVVLSLALKGDRECCDVWVFEATQKCDFFIKAFNGGFPLFFAGDEQFFDSIIIGGDTRWRTELLYFIDGAHATLP